LRPAAIIADAHADDAAHGAPDRKAEIAGLEVALLQVLEGARRIVVDVAGQMDLAVLADDASVAVGQNRRIEAMAVGVKLGIAERDRDVALRRRLEQRARRATSR